MKIQFAVCKEHHIVGSIHPTGKVFGMFGCVSTQQRGLSKNVVTQRMTRKNGVFEIIVYQFGRRVVVAFNLVAYHFNFFSQLGGGILTIKHHVG